MQLRRIWKGILALPLVLLALLVLYEAAGMAVNHWAGGRQTREMVRHLEKTLPQTEILDRYTEVGNTSGTGNHVDLLSAVLFRTAADPETVQQVCRADGDLDEWSLWAAPLEELAARREEHPEQFPFLEELAVPRDTEGCWLLYKNTGAPFPNHIEGH